MKHLIPEHKQSQWASLEVEGFLAFSKDLVTVRYMPGAVLGTAGAAQAPPLLSCRLMTRHITEQLLKSPLS